MEVSLTRIRAVIGGPRFQHTYPNGDQVAFVSTVFDAHIVSGTPVSDGDEITEVAWFDPAELAAGARDAPGSPLDESLPQLALAILDAVGVVAAERPGDRLRQSGGRPLAGARTVDYGLIRDGRCEAAGVSEALTTPAGRRDRVGGDARGTAAPVVPALRRPRRARQRRTADHLPRAARAQRATCRPVAAGIEPGGRISVLSPPRTREFVECYAAAARLGVTVVALNARHAPRRDRVLPRAGPPQLVIQLRGDLRARSPTRSNRSCSATGRRHTSDSWPRRGPAVEVPDPEPEQIHNVLFTSGTTGRPKGAMISQRAAATPGAAARAVLRPRPRRRLRRAVAAVPCRRRRVAVRVAVDRRQGRHLRARRGRADDGRDRARAASWTMLLPGVHH